MSITIQEALLRCIEHREIFADEMHDLMHDMMQGRFTAAQIAALLLGLRVKKETIGEITAAAKVMRELALPVPITHTKNLIDIVGTGGDGAHTFNISTAAMFVAAAAGAQVAKHGNRSVSSTSGSADVLEALGANIMLTPQAIADCMAATGIGFMFAPKHHSAMQHIAAVRKELGVRTIFNILGPLNNPAGATQFLMGVFHPDLVGIQIRTLHALGAQRALVVYGRDGIDEISLSASTLVGELRHGSIHTYEISPEEVGLTRVRSELIKVDSVAQSRATLLDALNPLSRTSPARDIVCFNSGAALYTSGCVETIAAGVNKARQTIESGAAQAKLEQFIAFTRTHGQALTSS